MDRLGLEGLGQKLADGQLLPAPGEAAAALERVQEVLLDPPGAFH